MANQLGDERDREREREKVRVRKCRGVRQRKKKREREELSRYHLIFATWKFGAVRHDSLFLMRYDRVG